eukprot:jgi/Botrbrau1/2895/Bobra.0036s0037.1
MREVATVENHQRDTRVLDIIVHPSFKHTLPTRSSPPAARVRLQDLPIDTLYEVCRAMSSARDLCLFEMLCRDCRSAASNDDLWKRSCLSTFPVIGNVHIVAPLTWREVYRFNHKLFYDVLVYRRPDKLLDLGHGMIFLNIPQLQ